MAHWNSWPGNSLDMECAGAPRGWKTRGCPSHSCPPSAHTGSMSTGSASPFSACSWRWRWHLGAGPWCCEGEQTLPLPCASMWAAPGHCLPLATLLLCLLLQQLGSSRAWKQHAPRLRLTYKGKGFLGVCTCLGGLGEHPAGRKKVVRTWGDRQPCGCGSNLPTLWALRMFQGCSSKHSPEDATPVLQPLEKGAGQRMPCPDPAEQWDQGECVLLLRLTVDLSWCVLGWG